MEYLKPNTFIRLYTLEDYLDTNFAKAHQSMHVQYNLLKFLEKDKDNTKKLNYLRRFEKYYTSDLGQESMKFLKCLMELLCRTDFDAGLKLNSKQVLGHWHTLYHMLSITPEIEDILWENFYQYMQDVYTDYIHDSCDYFGPSNCATGFAKSKGENKFYYFKTKIYNEYGRNDYHLLIKNKLFVSIHTISPNMISCSIESQVTGDVLLNFIIEEDEGIVSLDIFNNEFQLEPIIKALGGCAPLKYDICFILGSLLRVVPHDAKALSIIKDKISKINLYNPDEDDYNITRYYKWCYNSWENFEADF